MRLLGLMILGACFAAPGLAIAQEEILTVEAGRPQGAEEWRAFARTDSTVYLVDVGGVVERTGMRTASLARVPRQSNGRGPEIEIYEIRCAQNQMRFTMARELDETGAEVDSYEENGAFEPVPEGSTMHFMKQIVCDGLRPEGRGWPSLIDYMRSPRA
jgi:hypothetical protein